MLALLPRSWLSFLNTHHFLASVLQYLTLVALVSLDASSMADYPTLARCS